VNHELQYIIYNLFTINLTYWQLALTATARHQPNEQLIHKKSFKIK